MMSDTLASKWLKSSNVLPLKATEKLPGRNVTVLLLISTNFKRLTTLCSEKNNENRNFIRTFTAQ